MKGLKTGIKVEPLKNSFMGNRITVDAVYVTYNADIELFKRSIESIIPQVRKIYIVDNTPDKDLRLEIFKNEKVEVIYLGDNFGIAYAQNVGIKKALEEGADYILLSDQDTIYPPDFISKMLECFEDEKVAAAGPLFVDIHTQKTQGFVKKGLIGFKKIYPTSGKHEVFQLIASGTVIKAEYLSDIGLMKEELFIDWVDLEWCWRAIRKGYKLIGNADIVINHQLGNYSKNLGFRDVNLRSPIRHYYITRNAFYLALYSQDLDISHKITLFLKSFRYIVGYPILAKPRLTNLKYVLLGFWHGITKRLGKLT